MKIFDKLVEWYLKRQLSGGIITFPNLPSVKKITLRDYERLNYIYTCAEVRAENFASATLYVEDAQGNIKELEEVEEIAQLFTNLGMFSNFEFFYLSCMIRDLISEGVYYYVVRSSSGKALGLFVIPPTLFIRPVFNPLNQLEIQHYEINLPNGQLLKVAPQDIINIKRINPLNFTRGFSIIDQYEEIMKTYLELTGFLYSQTTNYALPPKLYIKLDDNVSEAIIRQFQEKWKEKREDFLRGMEIMALKGEIRTLGPTVQELDFVRTREQFKNDIRAAFRVPKVLLGETDQLNRATAEAARRAFIETVINPLWQFYLSKINAFLKKEFNVKLTFDYVQSMPFDEKVRALKPLWDAGIITLNEIRVDLGYNALVDGDKRLVALNMVNEKVQYENPQGGKTKKQRKVKETGLIAWARNERVFKKGVEILKPLLIRWFNKQKKEVLDKLLQRRNLIISRDLADEILSAWDKWVGEIKHEWEEKIRRIVEIAAERGKELLDLEVVSYDEFFVEQAILRGLRRIEDINDFTRELLARQIREGLLKNESISEIAKRIEAVFEGIKTWRAERIAWTEATNASNATFLATFKENGVESKMWLSMRDERVRDTHKHLDGVIVGIDEYFETIKGNFLLYPGDPSAPAGEVVNCRCTIVPV